jgi:hypothetical protein
MFQKLVECQVRGTLVTDMLSFAISDLDGDDGAEGANHSSERRQTPDSKITNSLRTCLLETFDGAWPNSVSLLSNLTMKGITYSAASRHPGNSSILLHSEQQGVLIPARIEHFVQLVLPDNINAPVTFVAVRRYQPANINHDPFSTFPFLRAQLWSRELDSLKLYTLESIESHFAYCPMEWEDQQVMAVISLSRVSD